jgi:hypothetical protein
VESGERCLSVVTTATVVESRPWMASGWQLEPFEEEVSKNS